MKESETKELALTLHRSTTLKSRHVAAKACVTKKKRLALMVNQVETTASSFGETNKMACGRPISGQARAHLMLSGRPNYVNTPLLGLS